MEKAQGTGSGWKRLGRVKKSKTDKFYIEIAALNSSVEAVEELLSRLKSLQTSSKGGKVQSVRLTLSEPRREGEYAEPEYVKFTISLPPEN